MRIALTGTFCVGKTSVAEAIGGLRSDIAVVPEAARDYFSLHPENTRLHHLYSVQHEIANVALSYLKLTHQNAHVLYDRTPLDAAAYYLALTGDKEFARVIASSCVAEVRKLDSVVMLSQVGVNLADDGLRIPDVRIRALFEEALDDIYRHEEIDYTVIHGSLDERIMKVASFMPGVVDRVAS